MNALMIISLASASFATRLRNPSGLIWTNSPGLRDTAQDKASLPCKIMLTGTGERAGTMPRDQALSTESGWVSIPPDSSTKKGTSVSQAEKGSHRQQHCAPCRRSGRGVSVRPSVSEMSA